MGRILGIIVSALLLSLSATAQRFFNLSPEDVKVDSVIPHFTYSFPLSGAFPDSVYSAEIVYPEFIDMPAADVANLQRISSDPLPMLPTVSGRVTLDRKQGAYTVGFCPLVYRGGKYRILASFMLRLHAKPVARTGRHIAAATRAGEAAGRYAAHSVLAQGKWAKIRVPASGVYELTDALIRQAGFSDKSKVRIYGYGGHLQNEILDGNTLKELDDLKEVPTFVSNGRRLFYAKGPVSWSSNTASERTRNPYSTHGYYFITSSDTEPATVDEQTFRSSFYPSPDDYHFLYENDGFSWYHGGRHLFDPEAIAEGKSKQIVLPHNNEADSGMLTVKLSAGSAAQAEVMLNDQVLGKLQVSLGYYDAGNEATGKYNIPQLTEKDIVTIKTLSGSPIRLDYVAMTWNKPVPAPDLHATFPAPEYVYNITNQDHHADGPADMVIIIPTSQKLLGEAKRLAAFHEQHDAMRVNIVPADELYNEFASGTPDANAYRRYLKMLYDRAATPSDAPRYLLLMGDGVWDNRLLTPECRNFNADDLLLCYESENSFNEVTCYVDDGFYCLLDDGEGGALLTADKLDVAVGRFPVTTPQEARIIVDKTIAYAENKNAGSWQNVLMFMGDDGDNNIHMRDINDAAEDIAIRYPGYQIKKVIWDAYTGETSSIGNTYPDVTAIIKKQQQAGALIMAYGGHGRVDLISHEGVLSLKDFEGFTNRNLPLWVTASCDILPFDGVTPTIGETAMLNPNGGAVAFFGTTRTVYSNYNKLINMAYMRYVLSRTDGKPTTVGEAQRLAKNYLITTGADRTTNKLQYSLLGDPALALHLPEPKVVIDSINGVATGSSETVRFKAGSIVRIAGHIEGDEQFNGVMSAVALDTRQLFTCKQNVSAGAEKPLQFYDRVNTLYAGSDSVHNGKFSFRIAVPMDINYADDKGLINIYAVNADHTKIVHGSTDNFIGGGSVEADTDSVGPKIYAYLNNDEFENGGNVNVTPYFMARLSDADGINVSGTGIGHDLQLIVDDDPSKTYILNENFRFDFGTYTSGTVAFSIPQLEPGPHKLKFRAWDVRNNSSVTTLDFMVVKGLKPAIYTVGVTQNPAKTATTFIVNHDLSGSMVDVTIDVFDTAGRLLWTHNETGVSSEGTYTVDWDLVGANGGRLETGVYLYRIRIGCDGSATASQAKKLVVIGNN